MDLTRAIFGRRPHDPARVAAAPQRVAAPAPAVCARGWNWAPTLADNLTLPTCTVAGLMNSLRAYALLHGFDLAATPDALDARLLALYAAVAGCEAAPEAIAATDGLVMLDVLNHVRANGFDYGGPAPVELTYEAIDWPGAARTDIAGLGSVYTGVTLYPADVAPDPVWNATPVGEPVGGHCIVPYSFGDAGMSVATWGETLAASDEWLAARVAECWAITWLLPVAA